MIITVQSARESFLSVHQIKALRWFCAEASGWLLVLVCSLDQRRAGGSLTRFGDVTVKDAPL